MSQKRTMGLTESYSKICHDHANCTTNLVGMIQLTGPLTADRIQQALTLMQKRHPVLRAFIANSDKKNDHLEIDDQPVTLPFHIISQESKNQWMDIVEQSIGTPFTQNDHYLWRLTLLNNKEDKTSTHTLIVTFLHSISDGLSVGTFFSELLDYLSQGQVPSLQDIKSLPFLPPVEHMLKNTTSWTDFLTKNMLKFSEFITLNKLNTYEKFVPLEQRFTKLVYSEIDESTLDKLLLMCRNENTTLTGLLTATLALAVYNVTVKPNSSRKLKQLTFTPVSTRKYCDPEINNDQMGCFVNFYQTKHIINKKQNLWKLARSYKHQLDKAIEDPGNMPPKQFSKNILVKSLASFNSGLTKNIFTYGIGVTNIGRIELPLQSNSLQVTKFYFGTNRNLGDWLTLLHVATVENRLFLSFCHAVPLLSETAATKIADEVVSILRNISDF